jgi:hypothetical protein
VESPYERFRYARGLQLLARTRSELQSAMLGIGAYLVEACRQMCTAAGPELGWAPDIPNYGLPTLIHMHMLNPNEL